MGYGGHVAWGQRGATRVRCAWGDGGARRGCTGGMCSVGQVPTAGSGMHAAWRGRLLSRGRVGATQ